jgi:endogenous inhibitor of DNA gyrase (YacG/DUF329 family)
MTLGADGLRCIGCGDRFVREGSNVSEYCSTACRPLVGGTNPNTERVVESTQDSSESDSKEGEQEHD